MADPAVGLILAALDVDIDNGAAWNRWYDLEHLAPNIALPGVSTGHRYVATPELHASRLAAADDGVWGGGRSVYLTWYATTVDPSGAISTMTLRRDELEAAGRMEGAGARIVRTGDALRLVSSVSAPALRLDADDLVHVGHRGLRLVLDRAERLASLGPHVLASLRFASVFQPGLFAELQLLDVPAAAALAALRSAEGDRTVVVDAGFDRIRPLDYDFLAAIDASDLPRSVADD